MQKILLGGLLFAMVLAAGAQPFSSTAGGGNWSAGSTWLGGTAPANWGNHTANVQGNITMNVSPVAGFTAINVSGGRTLTRGTMGTPANITFQSVTNINLLDGNITVFGNLTLDNATLTISTGALNVTGTLTLTNGAVINYNSAATSSIGALTTAGSGGTFNLNSGQLNTSGAMSINSAGRFQTAASAQATAGSITVSNDVTAQLINNGQITVAGNITQGGTLTNNASGLLQVNGSLTSSGSGSSVTTNNGQLNIAGSLSMPSSSRLQINPGGRTTIDGNASLSDNENIVVGTAVAPPPFAELLVRGNLQSTGSGDIRVNRNGRLAVFGDITASGGGTFFVIEQGAQAYVHGNINFTGAGSEIINNNTTNPFGLYVNGTITNSGGGSGTTGNLGDGATMQNTNPSFFGWVASHSGSPVGTYTWNGSVNADWTVAANWTPDRTTPSTVDDLIFNALGANRSITNVPVQTVGSILVTGNTSYSFAPAAGGNTLTLSLAAGNALQVDNGSTLSIGTVGSALNVNAPTSGFVEIGGQVTLVNGNLGVGGATLTLHTNAAPLARTSGQVSLDPASILNFGNAANTGGSTMVLPDGIFVSAPTIASLTVNRTNGVTLGNQAITIEAAATFTLGDLNTNAAGILIFSPTAAAPTESSASKIVGWAEMDFRTVGTGALNFLGFDVNAGADNMGSLRIVRRTGPDGVNTFNANESVAATWVISRVGGTEPTGGRNIRFSWVPTFDNGRPVTNQFQIYRFDSGPGWTAVGSLQALTATTPQRQTATAAVTDITDTFTVTDESQILPVQLLFFSASAEKNIVVTNWATASERNTDYFLLERSADGSTFLPLAEIKAVGNSRQRNDYFFEDRSPRIGRAFYRLTSVDFDGFREQFQVAAVDYAGERLAVVYPNPVEDQRLQVQLSFTPETPYAVSVTDMRGVEVLRFRAQGAQVALPFDVPAGIYLVRLAGDSFSSVSKVVVR